MAFSIVNNVFGFTKVLTISLYRVKHKISAMHIMKWIQSKGCCKTYVVILTLIIRSGMVMLTIFMRRFMLDLPAILHRTSSHQVERVYMTASNPEEYYRRVITAPFLDEVIAHIDTRFLDLQNKAIEGISIVPSVLIANMSVSNSYASFTKDLAELYADD